MVLYDIGSVKLLIISAITSIDTFALFHQYINNNASLPENDLTSLQCLLQHDDHL